MKRLQKAQQKSSSKIRRLIYIAKIGRPPTSFTDLMSTLRQLILDNPIKFESTLKQTISTTKGFNETELESAITLFNQKQDNNSFQSLINLISDELNQSILKRRQQAEQIVKQQGYSISPIGSRVFKISDTQDGEAYRTDLNSETCTCIDWQRISPTGMWCKHMYSGFGQEQNLTDLD